MAVLMSNNSIKPIEVETILRLFCMKYEVGTMEKPCGGRGFVSWRLHPEYSGEAFSPKQSAIYYPGTGNGFCLTHDLIKPFQNFVRQYAYKALLTKRTKLDNDVRILYLYQS